MSLREQIPLVRAGYDVACIYIGVNDARGPQLGSRPLRRRVRAALAHLSAHAERILTLTVPLDLGRPRAGAAAAQANGVIRELAREHGALLGDLSDLRGPRMLLPDAVHPTALGQLEIADRAARVLAGPAPASRRRPRRRSRCRTESWPARDSRHAGPGCSPGTWRAGASRRTGARADVGG